MEIHSVQFINVASCDEKNNFPQQLYQTSKTSYENMDCKDEDEQKSESIRDILRHYGGLTTAHGYAHFIESKSFLLKLFWVAAIVVCLVLVIIQIIPLVKKYHDNPVLVNVRVERQATRVFPAVVICNENIIWNSTTSQLLENIRNFKQKLGNPLPDTLHRVDVNEYADEVQKGIHNYSSPFSKFFESCKWQLHTDCYQEELWERYWHPTYGSCYVFNAAFHGNGSARSTVSSTGVGPTHSLYVRLNIHEEEYFTNFSSAAGIRLYVGNQNNFYEPHSQGHSLSPGFRHSVALKEWRHYRVDQFNNGSCMKNSYRKVYTHSQYMITGVDKRICLQLCFAEHTTLKCGCANGHHPRYNKSTPACNETVQPCILEAESDPPTECNDKCQPLCTRILVEGQISSLRYPVLQNYGNNELRYRRDNLLEVEIYFATDFIDIWEDKEFYFLENLLADIGGQLGLFSGCSVLTMLELAALLYVVGEFSSRSLIKRKVSPTAKR